MLEATKHFLRRLWSKPYPRRSRRIASETQRSLGLAQRCLGLEWLERRRLFANDLFSAMVDSHFASETEQIAPLSDSKPDTSQIHLQLPERLLGEAIGSSQLEVMDGDQVQITVPRQDLRVSFDENGTAQFRISYPSSFLTLTGPMERSQTLELRGIAQWVLIANEDGSLVLASFDTRKDFKGKVTLYDSGVLQPGVEVTTSDLADSLPSEVRIEPVAQTNAATPVYSQMIELDFVLQRQPNGNVLAQLSVVPSDSSVKTNLVLPSEPAGLNSLEGFEGLELVDDRKADLPDETAENPTKRGRNVATIDISIGRRSDPSRPGSPRITRRCAEETVGFGFELPESNGDIVPLAVPKDADPARLDRTPRWDVRVASTQLQRVDFLLSGNGSPPNAQASAEKITDELFSEFTSPIPIDHFIHAGKFNMTKPHASDSAKLHFSRDRLIDDIAEELEWAKRFPWSALWNEAVEAASGSPAAQVMLFGLTTYMVHQRDLDTPDGKLAWEYVTHSPKCYLSP